MAMYQAGINMNVSVDRDQLLETLRKNRKEHNALFEEAKKGYCNKALKAVQEKLNVLKEGHPVSLAFSFSPPQDMTSVYDTTIKMLEWSQDTKITLKADEFRKLIEDQWDWSSQWFSANSQYSDEVAITGS